MMSEAEQFLNLVKVDESMTFPERDTCIRNAMQKIADGNVMVLNIVDELRKMMDKDSN